MKLWHVARNPNIQYWNSNKNHGPSATEDETNQRDCVDTDEKRQEIVCFVSAMLSLTYVIAITGIHLREIARFNVAHARVLATGHVLSHRS